MIGSERSSVDELADVLAQLAAAEVDRLELSRRSLDQVSRRDYGLIVIDARSEDSVAFVNELARRLSSRRRECAVVVCHDPEPLTPALEHLVRRTRAHGVLRPLDADRLMQAVRGAAERGRDLATAAI